MSLLRLEWKRLAANPLPWVIMALSVALLAWIFLHALQGFLLAQDKLATQSSGAGFTDLVAVPLLSRLVLVALVLTPLVTMSALAGERRRGTLPLLLASGHSPARIVAAKFLAAWSWLLVLLALTLAMPLLLAATTELDYGKLAAATLGMALLMAGLTGIGVACSSLTRHPALAAGLAWLVSWALWLVNIELRAAGERGGLLDWLALPSHLHPMLRGLVASSDVVYLLLLMAVTLAIAIIRLGQERRVG